MDNEAGVAMDHGRTIHRKAQEYRWEGVEERPYKEDDRALFKSITRQVLFSDPEHARRTALLRGGGGRDFRRWSGMNICTRS